MDKKRCKDIQSLAEFFWAVGPIFAYIAIKQCSVGL